MTAITRNEDPIIQVRNISKQYNIGMDRTYKTFSESFTNVLKSPIKSLRSIGYQHDTFWALKDINFNVNRGEVVGIIGRNGAGKSTLLKILSRITAPTEGEIHLKGRVGSLLEVGTGFHPELTGRENIYFNGAILGMKKKEIDDKFDEIVKFSGVEKFLDTPVKRYSSGMQVRLAFSVAANLEPEILLIDEVLAVGDAAFQKKCLGKMGEVAESGRTVLFVSHNMGAVSSLCERGILLSKGKVEKSGDIESVVSYYIRNMNIFGNYCEDLINHPNRRSDHEIYLTNFVIENNNGVIYHGNPVKIRIGYNFKNIITVPQFTISFNTLLGIPVFTCISDYQKNNIPNKLFGKGEVTCEIKSLPLLPGSYTVTLKLWQPGQKLDEIENVTKIEVEWLNRDIGQFHWTSKLGLVYVDSEWIFTEGC